MSTLTDRELLEKAAKAAGIEINRWFKGSPLVPHATQNLCIKWNPLTDDGDALRLAVRLRIDVMFTDVDVEAISYVHGDGDGTAPFAIEKLGADTYAATRRAIVRAAAAMGEEK